MARPLTTIVDFCVFSQRLGGSRRAAFKSWRNFTPETSWDEFCEAWRAARAAERLAESYPGLRREP